MTQSNPIRVAINGYGVIGKRVADAVFAQNDMVLAGVADVATDWRLRLLAQKSITLFGATPEYTRAMDEAGLVVAGPLDALLSNRMSSSTALPSALPPKMSRPIKPEGSGSSSTVARSTA